MRAWKIIKNPEELKKAAAKKLSELLFGLKESPTLLLLSGGSSLGLVDLIDSNSIGKDLTVGMTDDRYSTDPAINNFALLKKTEFYKIISKKACGLISTEVKRGELLEEYGVRFDADLKEWRKKNKKGFVIATMGMGPDGHCCGVFPYPEDKTFFDKNFLDEKKWAIGYDVGVKNEFNQRVTITISFMRQFIMGAVSYISGQNKKEALARAFSPGELHETPARILSEIKNLTLFTDVS